MATPVYAIFIQEQIELFPAQLKRNQFTVSMNFNYPQDLKYVTPLDLKYVE